METDTQHCTGVMFYFNFLKLKREALSISFLFYHFAHLWGLTICYKVLLSNLFLVPDVWFFEVLARPNLPIYRNWTDKNITGRQQWSLLRDCQKSYIQSRAAFNLIQPLPLTALRCNSAMSCIKLRNVGNIYLKKAECCNCNMNCKTVFNIFVAVRWKNTSTHTVVAEDSPSPFHPQVPNIIKGTLMWILKFNMLREFF